MKYMDIKRICSSVIKPYVECKDALIQRDKIQQLI